jgi:hypothetical protein
MNEYVLVEFIAETIQEREAIEQRLEDMDEDFQLIKHDWEHEQDNMTGYSATWYTISGKMSSLRVSFIKLQDPFLSDRMRTSYISNELKDKYRK